MLKMFMKARRYGNTEKACLDLLQELHNNGELPTPEHKVIIRQEVSFPNKKDEPNRNYRVTVALV